MMTFLTFHLPEKNQAYFHYKAMSVCLLQCTSMKTNFDLLLILLRHFFMVRHSRGMFSCPAAYLNMESPRDHALLHSLTISFTAS